MSAATGITVAFDPRDLAKLEKKLAALQGQPLKARTEKAYAAAGALLVRPLRAAAPLGKGHTFAGQQVNVGALRKSIGVKKLRPRGWSEMAATYVGPRKGGYIQRFVVEGTSPHDLAPRQGHSNFAAFADGQVRSLDTLHHPGAKADPYVGPVMERELPKVMELIRSQVFQSVI